MKLFLQFQIGQEGYVLEATRIACVLPLLDIKSIPRTPAGVVGVFNYRGKPVPVIDLSELALGVPAPRHLSTRLILVLFAVDDGPDGHKRDRLLGLIAEKVTETIRRGPADFAPAGVTSAAAPYLGPVTSVGGRLLQWIDVPQLLPREVSETLFRDIGESA
jgi:chemotaxis-related protein WspB